jgi:hypothetical protein
MSNPRYVDAHGKRILVETLEMPDRPVRKARRKAFTQLPLDWAAETAKAAGTPGAIVWILLCHMAWKTKRATFPLSNMILARYGIDRKTKYRILANLEKAGRIKTEHRNKQAPLVTLLDMPK